MTEHLGYEPLTPTQQWQLRHAPDIVRFPEEAIFHRLKLPDLARAINSISGKDFDGIMEKAIGDHEAYGELQKDRQSELTENYEALKEYQKALVHGDENALPSLEAHALEEYGDILILRERMMAMAQDNGLNTDLAKTGFSLQDYLDLTEDNQQLLLKLQRFNGIHMDVLRVFKDLGLSPTQARTLAEIKHSHRHARALAGLKAKDKEAERLLIAQGYDSIKKL